MAPLLQGNYREFGKVLACSCVNTFLCHICPRIDGLSRGLFHLQKPPPPFRRQGNSPEKRASQDKVFRSISAPRAAFGGCAPKRFAAARSATSGQRLCLWKPQPLKRLAKLFILTVAGEHIRRQFFRVRIGAKLPALFAECGRAAHPLHIPGCMFTSFPHPAAFPFVFTD